MTIEFGKHLGKGAWGLADKALPVVYGIGYVLLVIRVLPEEEFGSFVLAQEIFLVISGLATAFALQPLLKFASEHRAERAGVVTVSLVFNIGFTILAALALIMFRRSISDVLHAPSLASLAPFIAGMLLASLVRNIALVLLQTRFCIADIFWVDAVHFLGAPLLTWVLSRLHLFNTALDLMVINMISLSASSVAGIFLTTGLWEWTRRPTRADIRDVWEYGTFSLGGNASFLMYSKADTFILAGFSGPLQVALYNSVKVFTRIFDMVTQVVQMFFLPATSRLSSKGETASLVTVVEKGILFSTVGMLPVLVGMAAGAPFLISLLYEGKYPGGVPLLQVFSLLSLVVPTIAVASNTLLGLGYARENFLLGLHMLWISVASYLLLIPLWGAPGAAAGYVIASFLVALLMARSVRRFLPITPAGVLRRIHDITSFVWRRIIH